jgi:hypothetical protein
MNQAINEMEVTAEEVEAMDALCRLGAGVPLLNISDGGRTVQYATPQFSPQPSAESLHKPESQVSPEALIDEMVAQFSIKLKLLLTVINQTKAQPNTTPPEGNPPEQSLQECVSLTLQQAGWFKEMVKEIVEEKIDDMDFDYQVESAVESYFSNSFSLDDHVDITAEVESRIEEIVEEQLADIVSDKLRNLRITFD